jgi:hypothetical protein
MEQMPSIPLAYQSRYYGRFIQHEKALISLLCVLETKHHTEAKSYLANASVDRIEATMRAVSAGVSWNDVVKHGPYWANMIHSVECVGESFDNLTTIAMELDLQMSAWKNDALVDHCAKWLLALMVLGSLIMALELL